MVSEIGLVVVALLLTAVLARRLASRPSTAASPGFPGTPSAVADPWTRAEHLARDGRIGDALHALYAAVIASLASTRALDPHPAKTTGDYARELGSGGAPGVAVHFRDFTREYERAVFGTDDPPSDAFARLREMAMALAGRR